MKNNSPAGPRISISVPTREIRLPVDKWHYMNGITSDEITISHMGGAPTAVSEMIKRLNQIDKRGPFVPCSLPTVPSSFCPKFIYQNHTHSCHKMSRRSIYGKNFICENISVLVDVPW